MPVPLMSVTLKLVWLVAFEMLPLVTLQTPAVEVVHLRPVPPTVKLPVTMAPATAAPLASLTVMPTVARQPLRMRLAEPVKTDTDTTVLVGGGGSVPVEAPVNISKLGEPAPALVTLPTVALVLMASPTCAGVADGVDCRICAASPATCGEAMDVPLIVLVAVVEVDQVDLIELPGAKRSTQVPVFEKLERASLLDVAPTVMADGSRAGE